MRTGLCNGIVFHDFDVTQVDVKGLFCFMEQWFTEHGYPPNRAGYEAEGLPKSEKTKTFKYVKQSFEKINYQGIKNFSMMSVLPDGFDGSDFVFSADYDSRLISFMFDESEYAFKQDSVNQLIKQLLLYASPKYGYAFQRNFKLGPAYYNMGMIMGIPRDEKFKNERWQIAEWFRHYFVNQKYQTGQYRDIYPYNIICEKHLDLEVEGKKLADWISDDPCHGMLTQLKENLWLWNIADENISLVREALRPTGQVICI